MEFEKKLEKIQLNEYNMSIVRKMLSIGTECGLENEVIVSFAEALRNSDADLEECAIYALSNWDLI